MARTETVAIRAGQELLSGTLTLPGARHAPSARWPAVLLLASWLPRDRHGRLDHVRHRSWFAADGRPDSGLLSRLAQALAVRGVASLRYDKRGSGRSGGDWSTSGPFTLIDDARDAIAVLRGHPAVDPVRIGIVGHGEGAAIAMSVAAADPGIGPLTLVGAPARGLRDVVRRSIAERHRAARTSGSLPRHPFVAAFDRSFEELVERADRGERSMRLRLDGRRQATLGLAGWEQAFRVSGLALATLQARSVTVVHGMRDEWVDPDEAGLLVGALAPTAAPAMVGVPNAGHELREAAPTVIRDLAADLAARLQPRRLPSVLLAVTDPPPARE